jgi:hypothetical protein
MLIRKIQKQIRKIQNNKKNQIYKKKKEVEGPSLET